MKRPAKPAKQLSFASYEFAKKKQMSWVPLLSKRSLKSKMKAVSMFDVSLDIANTLFIVSNVLLVVGALFGVVGAFGVFYAGGIRERYADERISTNEASTARALADAAKANERAATLDKEALELKLELAKRTQPLVARGVSRAQIEILKSSFAGRNLTIGFMFPTTDLEVVRYAEDLERALTEAGVSFGMRGGANSQISSGGNALLGNR
jgi:hypothetical protein